MNPEYDRKFEEMKKYIPFLESMIKRLEMTSSVSNPRQAQLDKIKSLRDLLMDKKKRMKMENLLKCEQVLINLYEKVEQRDSLPVLKKGGGNTFQKDKADLNIARNKLKSTVTKLQGGNVETLPEIARASETEQVCVPGSKEPALFQRRPNKSSVSPVRSIPEKINEQSPQTSKRNYTRVLLSPEPENRWPTEESSSEKAFFGKRSPIKSPRRRSLSYNKKERKKLAKNKPSDDETGTDLNITLKMPEESLDSLNTKDMLSRIINCSDGDVDIGTLRELRKQILGELKDTGTNEDISDLILKSYKKKTITDKKKEIEEGELSDSESEAIESIYGSLAVTEKEKPTNVSKKIPTEESRKIQISLVINSDKNKCSKTNEQVLPVDSSDLKKNGTNKEGEINNEVSKGYGENIDIKENALNIEEVIYIEEDQEVISIEDDNYKVVADFEKNKKGVEKSENIEQNEVTDNESIPKTLANSEEKVKPKCDKPIIEQNDDVNKCEPENQSNSNNIQMLNEENIIDNPENVNLSTENSNAKIPLLENADKISEIDILQALKKEILSETNNVLSSDAVTPALHQPKIIKVGNANEVGSKKRISIENYKAKANTSVKNILGHEVSSNVNKDDLNRKQSLKLTDKECERFNVPSKLTINESSEDDEHCMVTGEDFCQNLAPKSPDHEDFADTGIKPPVIIPSDPIKTTAVSSEVDIDMRKTIPVLQARLFGTEKDNIKNKDKLTVPLLDPRMKIDLTAMVNTESSSPYIMNTGKAPRSALDYGNTTANLNVLQNVNSISSLAHNVTTGINISLLSPNMSNNITPNMVSNMPPNITPIRTQNLPNITPTARSYDMTPSQQTIDNEDYSNQKHVYAPIFTSFDTRDHSEKPQWDSLETKRIPIWEDSRSNLVQRDTDYRDRRQRDGEFIPAFEHYRNSPRNDGYNFDKLDQCHKTDGQTTQNHPFGRLDCQNLLNPFVNMDVSMTPVPPFGRSDCPSTPIHPFGRSDCPSTPSHPFGRSECPSTPINPFGRSECPSTPIHPFGRPDTLPPLPFVRPDFNHQIPNQSFGTQSDRRFKRNSDYDMYHNRNDDRDQSCFQDRNFNSNSFKSDHINTSNNPDLYRRYQREQSLGRNERNNYDHAGRNYRESRRETSVGRYNRDYDNDRSYTRNHGSNNRSYDSRQQNDDKNGRRSYKRERSHSQLPSRSSRRDSSMVRSFPKENQSSIQRHVNQSFIIDTSVNSTFQKNNNDSKFSSFNARRQRAASVGRTLGRVSPNKVQNNDPTTTKIELCNNFEIKNKDNKFRRACSVGRDIKESKLDFKDIKADLKSFKLKGDSKWNREKSKTLIENDKNCEPRNKKEIMKSENKSSQGIKYTATGYNRDPRMRRQNSYESKSTKDNTISKSQNPKSVGIVYSNDNITKGTILGPGYGVKNYKIPKIKRPQETVVEKEIIANKFKENKSESDTKISLDDKSLGKISDKNESNTLKNKIIESKRTTDENKAELTNKIKKPRVSRWDLKEGITETTKSKDTHHTKQKNDDDLVAFEKQELESENSKNQVVNTSYDNVEKRITRSTSKVLSIDSLAEVSPVRRKKGKRSYVYETDSDDNEKEMKHTLCDKPPLSNKVLKSNDKKTSSGESSFGMDDLEIFTGNITSDPVIDNINALIADYDNALDTSKPVDTDSNFNRELTLETMLENITSPENDIMEDTSNHQPETLENVPDSVISLKNVMNSKLSDEEKKVDSSLKIDKQIISDVHNINSDLQVHIDLQLNSDSNNSKHILSENNINMIESQEKQMKIEVEENNSEAIVSTSEEGDKQNSEKLLRDEPDYDKTSGQTKPDSTINSNCNALDNCQKNLPDSTNDINSEMNSVISSTHNSSDNIKPSDNSDSCNPVAPASKENISKLLSIKIKELLGLLGDQSSDNEKIKKKLEKLSEIVSDDDEESTVEIGKERSDLKEEKINETVIGSFMGNKEKENIDNIDNGLVNQSTENINNVNSISLAECRSLKENEIVSEVNEENRDDTIAKLTEINNKLIDSDSDETISKVEEKISTEPDKDINKVKAQDINVKPRQITSKKKKKGKKKTKRIAGVSNKEKRLTRSDVANLNFDKQPAVKKPSRELQKLQEDIKYDIESATGIRMCRLAKLVDETKNQKVDTSSETSNQDSVEIMDKCNDSNSAEGSTEKLTKKKKTAKRKKKNNVQVKPMSSSITKLTDQNSDLDSYMFEADESKNTSDTKNDHNTSESEGESIYSSKSFGSTEVLADVKKKGKRKRSKGWKAGIIKPKNKKKKIDRQIESVCSNESNPESINKSIDTDCFTDKNYCFDKNLSSYECRLCSYNGADIVCHYKKEHPHSEIALSRMSPEVALEAIKESEKFNFQVTIKASYIKYICRFCFKEFGGKKPVLESFFWHVVSMHTGEYKQLCSECSNVEHCPFSLDIPPPPKENAGQLLGYVCEKCNYTQISIENLKSHVIIRHNDEQTAVYTINLSVTEKGIINNPSANVDTYVENQLPRVLRSSRSNQSVGEGGDGKSDSTDDFNRSPQIQNDKSEMNKVAKIIKIQSKITFENDNTDELLNYDVGSDTVKVKTELNEHENFDDLQLESENTSFDTPITTEKTDSDSQFSEFTASNDITNCAHFKIKYSETGSKEYICCINGNDLHYRTTLLISFKKHVQLKHSEIWDGYCFICKAIVTTQGVHLFKDCLQHFLDQHIDNFPVMQDISENFKLYEEPDISNKSIYEDISKSTKSYINVRPLADLISQDCSSQRFDENTPLPIIESVISLGAGSEHAGHSSYTNPESAEIPKLKYEKAQAEIMSRKHRVVLEAMMSHVKLVKIFKCAGRFCSFTTDSAEDALVHASTHMRVGGEDSLKCVYCDFDSSSNAIDLITHVFKSHGCCQYVCGMCFYRAVSNQLVNAHIKRVHGESTPITILRTTIQTAPITEDNILPRNVAVPYYLCCANNGSEGPCKFRTYTPGKFCEHLEMRHSSATEHSCFMCSAILSTPADLIRHLKIHGLKLYQCAWCVFAADNETEFLAHASANHPDKQPKAYLRIITNKEGTSELRVLPLAHLNKCEVPVIDVTTANINENPVREAERSIELEKLIGQTTFMIESMAADVETRSNDGAMTFTESNPQVNEAMLENTNVIQLGTSTHENQSTSMIKTESFDTTPEKCMNESNVVYYLDSDDEDTGLKFISTSTNQSSNTQDNQPDEPKMLPLEQLFLCEKCDITFKCGTSFKKHMRTCFYRTPDPIQCAHCPIKVKKRDILIHYTKTHLQVAQTTTPEHDHTGNSSKNTVKAEKSVRTYSKATRTIKRSQSVRVKRQSKESATPCPIPHTNKSVLGNTSSLNEYQTMSTPTHQSIDETTLQENQLTPILKSEIHEMTPENNLLKEMNVVYCLDSEDEDGGQSVIDLSTNQVSNTLASIKPKILPLSRLFLCGKCNTTFKCGGFKKHIVACFRRIPDPIPCAHCSLKVKKRDITAHYTKTHSRIARPIHFCSKCPKKFPILAQLTEHERNDHAAIGSSGSSFLCASKVSTKVQCNKPATRKRKRSLVSKEKTLEPPEKLKRFGPNDVNLLPINPILDDSVFCSLCEFSTKVRLNMVRHLQLHSEQQIVSQTAPVNPVPHLESNEKHFDKMLNLASSSIVSRTDKSRIDNNATISLMIPPEAVSRYPKYVPERHRHTCGAKNCSYISVDESMFKCHWETLHSGSSDYRCVHCPPHQLLDTSQPLTAARIIAHLKMHDAALYACSVCSYYHYKRLFVETHLDDVHKAIGQVMVVREEGGSISANTCQAQISAPTMDLKPWQCGLCKFKSLLRPEVVDHCAKVHNSKMQYKCAYCAFKTSNSENITKHQQKSHSDRREEIFYYYYREGSVPEDPDGTPLWQRQSLNCNSTKSTIKSEVTSEVFPLPQISAPISLSSPLKVDLNLVKKEVMEPVEDTVEDLCKDYGEFCEPNGLKYKCSLCKIVVEDHFDAMQSHLYEELKYRKWGCSICSYKAFHKSGLNEHMQTEHRQNKDPIALQIDKRIETWVVKLLEYQTQLIEKNKENLAKQKEEILRSAPGSSRPKSPPNQAPVVNEIKQSSTNSTNKPTMVELERLFGSLGASVNMTFCCPKCHSTFKDEESMKNHLESELNKIRWYCSNCSVTFQTYHEAQFHCRSIHQGQSSRPVEASRDPSIRLAWVEAVIRVQKLTMNYVPLPSKSGVKDTDDNEEESDACDNSLLVVRYEEKIPTPEEQMIRKSAAITDSEEDKLIVDEPIDSRRQKAMNNCPHCIYTTMNARTNRAHVLRHFNLRPFTCSYCGIDGNKKILEQHHKNTHSNQPIKLILTEIPTESPSEFLKKQSDGLHDKSKFICLVCQNVVTEAEKATHVHEHTVTSFGKKGDVVVKCSICLTLHKDITAYFNHHKEEHGTTSVNYVFDKLNMISNESKVIYYAPNNYEQSFPQTRCLKTRNEINRNMTLNHAIMAKPQVSKSGSVCIDLDEEEDEIEAKRRKMDLDLPKTKQVAKKSTTKLPFIRPFARKSTTKLPFTIDNEEPEEFSYYGTKPSTEGLDEVTTMMPFCNTMMPFTMKQLRAIINIDPVVRVEELKL